MIKKKEETDSLAHTKWNCKYHIVFAPKYRRQVIYGQIRSVCVLSGTANAGQVLEDIRSGKRAYDFIEIMACPGGCVNGGGQPLQPSVIRNFRSVSAMRAGALYQEDQEMPLRKSHKSPLIQEVYEHYLDQPGSQRAHQLLHTCYTDRSGQHR